MNKIFGIGVDLVTKTRFDNIIKENYGKRLIHKMLHPNEIIKFKESNFDQKTQFLANRWSVKESIVKALNKKDINFAEIELTKDTNGKPKVIFYDNLKKYIIDKNISQVEISITHEDEKTISFVIIN